MSAQERTLAVIEAFYDAALDETLWPAALKKSLDLTGSLASSFRVLDGSDDPRLPTFLCINFDQNSIHEYLDGMAQLDPTGDDYSTVDSCTVRRFSLFYCKEKHSLHLILDRWFAFKDNQARFLPRV